MNDNKNGSISLIIPAFNESKRIGLFLETIVDYTRKGQRLDEIIVVDDGSQDNTKEIVLSFQDRLPLQMITFAENKGKGAAVQAGVKKASGDYVVFMDADGATPIEELATMITAAQASGADIIVGNRWQAGSKTRRHSFMRKMSGWVYRKYMGLFGLGKIDTMCGFKGFKQEVGVDLFNDLLEPRWLFDTEIAYRAVVRGYKIVNIPICWESKDGSKLGTGVLLKSALEIWPLILEIKKNEREIAQNRDAHQPSLKSLHARVQEKQSYGRQAKHR